VLVVLHALFVLNYCVHNHSEPMKQKGFPQIHAHSNMSIGILIPDLGSPFILPASDINEAPVQLKTDLCN
jgi:hypothetical protein